MKKKLISAFAIFGVIAAVAGAVAYILKFKKEIDGIVECD